MAEWYWPVPSSTNITSDFGYRTQPTEGASTNHKGIDIGASYGSDIVAASAGKVISSGTANGYGQWIRIDHGNGVISIYGHMQTRLVSVGDTVTAGQVIAEVGSEGVSTGPHLHFQIEKNGTPVDPLSYVSSDSPTYLSEDYNPTSTSTLSEDVPTYMGDPGGIVVGQRVSGLTEQPIFAFINIWLGDNLLATNPAKPNLIQSLEVDYLDDAGTELLFVIFDDNWEEIEYNLSQNHDNVYVQYGYYGTDIISQKLKCRITNYSIEFTATGTILSVTALSEEAVDNLSPVNLELDTDNPTLAAKRVCEYLGYEVLDENFDESEDIHADNPFNIVEEFPLTYLMRVVIPQASKENGELFHFYTEYDESSGKIVAYFKKKSLRSTNTDNLRTYIYQKGYDSTVLDFSVNIEGIFGGSGDFQVAKSFRSSVLSTSDKQEVASDIDVDRSITEATGSITHTKMTKTSVVAETSGLTADQASRRLYYRMKSSILDGYTATLRIVGDPTIRFWGDGNYPFIRIINVTDNNHFISSDLENNYQYLHHTSGIYMVNKIHHSISGGMMYTDLELSRAATQGDVDSLEIINPRYYIK